MKKIFSFILLFTAIVSFSQDKENLELRANEMYTLFMKGDAKVIEYIYPRIFEKLPKETLIETIQSKNTSSENLTTINIDVPRNFEFGPITKIGNSYYSVVYFDTSTKFIFKKKIKKANREMTIDFYKNSNSAYEAIYDSQTNSIITKSKVTSIAVFNDYSDSQWTFSFGLVPDANILKDLGLE